jgi:cytochrome c-type biogenesis protein CcsB
MMKTRLVLLMVLFFAQAAWAVDMRPLEFLAVQDGGRKKPLDTFARESLQKLAGRSTWKDSAGRRWSGLEVVAAMALGPLEWDQAPLLRLSYHPLKQELGLPMDRIFFSFQELSTNTGLSRVIGEISQRRNRAGEQTALTRMQHEAASVLDKLEFFSALTNGSALRLIPPSPQSGSAWFPVSEVARVHPEKATEITRLYRAVREAYQKDDAAAFAASVHQFQQQVRALSPQVYPEDAVLQRELLYNHSHPFRWAWLAYLFALLVMLAATGGTTGRRLFYGPAMGLFLMGFALQVYGFVMRCWIAGRPPVTNMYEVMIFVAFGAVLFALLFELKYRSRFFVLAGSAVGVISLILADNLPNVLNPSIQPLVPVLRSNYWLTVHVLTITLGYAAFLLALGIGHIALGFYVLKPGDKKKIDELTRLNYRTLQIGVLFLTAGTILGGVWANYSWGRFWGWDPKETWALIALLCYLVVLHGCYSGWMGGFALNAASVVCFQAIIMAAYGVNYVLGTGKHSYGFGAGGEWAVGTYVLAELMLVALAVWRYRLINVPGRSTAATDPVASFQSDAPMPVPGRPASRNRHETL